jgi:hypothetical protein
MRADHVLRALSRQYQRKGKVLFLTEVKTGPTWTRAPAQRLDALAITKSWTKPSIVGFEVKVRRSDFLKDDKWPGYLDFCHRMYFVCPEGLIKPAEMSGPCGLIYVTENGGLRNRKRAPFREIELPWTLFYHLVISHMDDDRHPFFSDQREYLESYVEDRKDRQKLAWSVRMKFAEDLERLRRERAALGQEKDHLKEDLQRLKGLEEILREFGIDRWSGNELRERLRRALPSRFVRKLQWAMDHLDDLLREAAPGTEKKEQRRRRA